MPFPAGPLSPLSEVDRPPVHRQRGFLDALRQGRMAMADPGDVLGRAAERHRRADLVDQRAGVGAEDVRAEDAVGPGVRQDLDLPFGVEVGPSPAVGGEREDALAVRSEEHTSELQSLMRISYAVFCLKKKNKNTQTSKHLTMKQH